MESRYQTKKALREAVRNGKFTRDMLIETSMFGPEWADNGRLTVEGPPGYHKYYANITVRDGEAIKVS